MGLINYKEIDFKKSIDNENKIVDFNGSEIRVLNYLPTHEKNDLIMITLQKSFENNIYNYYKLKMYFDLHLIYLYTNIVFDAEDRANEEGLYDLLKKSRLINAVTAVIDPIEIETLWNDLLMVKESLEKYQNSFAGFLNDTLDELSEKVKDGTKLLKDLNIQDYLKENPQILQLLQQNLKGMESAE